jgi:hypothetical protein
MKCSVAEHDRKIESRSQSQLSDVMWKKFHFFFSLLVAPRHLVDIFEPCTLTSILSGRKSLNTQQARLHLAGSLMWREMRMIHRHQV